MRTSGQRQTHLPLPFSYLLLQVNFGSNPSSEGIKALASASCLGGPAASPAVLLVRASGRRQNLSSLSTCFCRLLLGSNPSSEGIKTLAFASRLRGPTARPVVLLVRTLGRR